MKNVIATLFVFISFQLSGQVISTVAGSGVAGYSGDGGLATGAGIGNAGYIAFDSSGNYYITEANNTIRKISVSGIISTIAGNGTAGFSGDGSMATAAQFNFGAGGGIAVDAGNNVYLADQGNNRVRKIHSGSGIVTTIAGTGTAGFSGDGGPATAAMLNGPTNLTIDSLGNLFVMDGFNYRIRKITPGGIITTIAGTGVTGFSGDGGPATAANINADGSVIIGKSNTLLLADGNRIRRINLTSGIISTIAGTGLSAYSGDGGPATAAQFLSSFVAQDNIGNIYVSDRNNHRVRRIDNLGIITTATGNGIGAFMGDGGPAITAQIYSPRGLAIDQCNNVYIVDNNNRRVRKIEYTPMPTITHTITPSPGDTICAGTVVTYSSTVSGGTPLSYSWYVNGVAHPATGSTFNFTPTCGDIIECRANVNAACTYADVNSNIIQVGVHACTTSVAITPGPIDTVCATMPAGYIATLTGGSAAGYKWYVNGSVVSTFNTHMYTPTNGDSIWCDIKNVDSSCGVYYTSSNMVHIVVDPVTVPTVTVTAASSASLCAGTPRTFSAAISGSPSPNYQWYLNGAPMSGGTSSTFTYSSLHCGDSVSCRTSVTYPCGNVMASDGIFPAAYACTTLVAITPVPNDTVFAGTPVTYNATLTGGASAGYKWYVNGSLVSTSGASYTYTPANGDSIWCDIKNVDSACGAYTTPSNTVHMVSLQPNASSIINPVVLNIHPNPAKDQLALSAATQLITVTLYNLTGQQVLCNEINSTSTTINLTELPTGIYLLKAADEYGAQVIKKVVKE